MEQNIGSIGDGRRRGGQRLGKRLPTLPDDRANEVLDFWCAARIGALCRENSRLSVYSGLCFVFFVGIRSYLLFINCETITGFEENAAFAVFKVRCWRERGYSDDDAAEQDKAFFNRVIFIL